MDRFKESHKLLNLRAGELYAAYPDQYVGVLHQSDADPAIEHAPTLDELMCRIQSAYQPDLRKSFAFAHLTESYFCTDVLL